MAKQSAFITNIVEGMERFGMKLNSQNELSDGLHRIIMTDTAHGTGYVALARKKDAGNPEKFWKDVIDNKFKDLIKKTSSNGVTLPAALIVPSAEAETVINISKKMDMNPSAYQLFDGFVVVGYKRTDTATLIKEDPPPQPKKIEEPQPQTPKETAPVSPSPAPEPQPAKPQEKVAGAGVGEKTKKTAKTLAAAAILGVAVASIPFAINKFMDSDDTAYVEETPTEQLSIDHLIHGNAGDIDTLSVLAANAPLNRYELKELVAEGYLFEVAQNPHMPAAELRRLASHPDPNVRAAVAANKNTTSDIVTVLSRDSDPVVRASAAANPKLPVRDLERLGADGVSAVQSAVLDNPNLTPKILDMIEPDIMAANCGHREKIFAGSCATPAMLLYNVNNPDPCIRLGIARNPRTPQSTLKTLLDDPNPYVRQSVLENSNIASSELERFFPAGWVSDLDPNMVEIRVAALRNPAVSPRYANELMALNPGIYGRAYQNYAKSIAAGKLSPYNAEKLYNYAHPKGGMEGFIKEINQMPKNMGFVRVLRDERAADKNWKITLRKSVNRAFRNNVFDPVASVNAALDESAGRSNRRPVIIQTPFNRVSVPQLSELSGDDGEFFDKDPVFALLDNENEHFSEFFADQPKVSSADGRKIQSILNTADSIVDDIMDGLVPAMERSMNSLPPNADVALAIRADGDILQHAFSITAPSGGQSPATGGNAAPTMFDVISNNAYDNMCKKLISLHELVY